MSDVIQRAIEAQLLEAHLAVHGRMLAGKTTYSEGLVDRGFVHVNFTQYLKILAADMLTAAGKPTTVAAIEADKAYYRSWLQATGTVLGFDKGFGVEEALAHYGAQYLKRYISPAKNPDPAGYMQAKHVYGLKPLVVFDNVRSQEQIDMLKRLYPSFRLCRIVISEEVQFERALSLGYDPDEFERQKAHPIERQLPKQPDEITLDGEAAFEDMYQSLLRQLSVAV